MILLKIYCTVGLLSPLALILAKWLGWIGLNWVWTVYLAILIPVLMFLALAALAVYIIKVTPIEEWKS